MYNEEQLEKMAKREEDIRFITNYVRTHTEEQIKDDYHQKENNQKLYSLQSMLNNKKLFATMKEEDIAKYIKYLKETVESEIQKDYYEGKTGVIPNEKPIPNQSLNMTLESKEFFASMTNEQVEEYIKNTALNDTLHSEETNLAFKHKDGVLNAITNVRYLTEQEHSFKNHIKNKIKGFEKDKDYIGLLSFSGISGALPLIADHELKIPLSITCFSVVLAAQIAILGYKYTKEWFDMVNSSEKNIEILKKEGIYDLLIDSMKIKKENEQKYSEEIRRGR